MTIPYIRNRKKWGNLVNSLLGLLFLNGDSSLAVFLEKVSTIGHTDFGRSFMLSTSFWFFCVGKFLKHLGWLIWMDQKKLLQKTQETPVWHTVDGRIPAPAFKAGTSHMSLTHKSIAHKQRQASGFQGFGVSGWGQNDIPSSLFLHACACAWHYVWYSSFSLHTGQMLIPMFYESKKADSSIHPRHVQRPFSDIKKPSRKSTEVRQCGHREWWWCCWSRPVEEWHCGCSMP